MKANQRRQLILETLNQSSQPISASQLAKQLEVSRQVIVGDVALLRASNHDILSTPKGYCLAKEQTDIPLREGWFAATGQRIQRRSFCSSWIREAWYWMWRLSIQSMAC